MKDIRDYNLKNHNTFGIEAKCKRFVEFDSVDELKTVLGSLDDSDRPLLVIGGGSNLLFTNDYEGTVLHSAIKGHTVEATDGGVLLRCGSGEVWDDIVKLSVENNWHGAENLSLIYGDVGACAVQNIGAYGLEAKDIIYRVEAVEIETGKIVAFSNADCEYAYRQSKFKREWRNQYVITYVTFALSNDFVPNIEYGNIRSELEKEGINTPNAQQLRDVIIKIRESKLPNPDSEGNAGSFFMNPIVPRSKFETLALEYPNIPHYMIDANHIKIPAGWMIEQCGWKGRTLGRVGVHARQALVLVNKGGATGQEVLSLCKAVQQDVYKKFGIEINPEVNIL